jgi:hypothetical protein
MRDPNEFRRVMWPDKGLKDNGLGVLVWEISPVVERLVRPAEFAYLNDDGQFVARTDDLKQGVHLKDRVHINVAPVFGTFGVDWGGKYYVFADALGSTIGPVGSGGTIAAIPTPFGATRRRLGFKKKPVEHVDALGTCGGPGPFKKVTLCMHNGAAAHAGCVVFRGISSGADQV